MKSFDPSRTLCNLKKYLKDYVEDYITLVTSEKPCLCKKCDGVGPEENICKPVDIEGFDIKGK